MSKVEKHPTDEGKFQSTFDTYGHGKGNGKSRAAVYKHSAKIATDPSMVVGTIKHKPKKTGKNAIKKNRDTESLRDSTKTNQSEESDDFVESDSTKTTQWEDIEWLQSDEDEDGIRPTIASPIRRLATGEGTMSAAQQATQSQLIRWGYMGLDRGITHWGRGVMNKPDYTIQRHSSDYDALEAATSHAMSANGVHINLSPTLVWGVVVGAAYGPPLGHIARNSDPLIRRSVLRRFGNWLMRPSKWFKRRRVVTPPPIHGSTFGVGTDEN